MDWYIALVIAGVILLFAELIIPGGVIGALGALLLVGAIVLGFFVFAAPWNVLSALVIVGGTFIGFLVWMNVLPKTRIGRSLTLVDSTQLFKATLDHREWMGKEGIAQTDLRPAGIAIIDDKRLDVVAENNWIEDGTPVKVVKVEGNRIAVRALKETG